MLKTLVPGEFPYRPLEMPIPTAPVSTCTSPQEGKQGRSQLRFPPTPAHLPMRRPLSATTLTFLVLTLFHLKGIARREGQKFPFCQCSRISYEAGEHSAEASSLDSLSLYLSSIYSQHNSWSDPWKHVRSHHFSAQMTPFPLQSKKKVFTMVCL